jgi:hypothetical protein
MSNENTTSNENPTVHDDLTMQVRLVVDAGDAPYAYICGEDRIAVEVSGLGSVVTLVIPQRSALAFAGKFAGAVTDACRKAILAGHEPDGDG